MSGVLNVPVSRLQSPSEHATTVGAAILAGTAIGLFPDLTAGTALLKRLDTALPDPEIALRYEKLHLIYRKLYRELIPIFDDLASYRKDYGI